ncbi:hypothetical protein GC197_05805 [bacterium]|nr:hypothetical protein [bacterium]
MSRSSPESSKPFRKPPRNYFARREQVRLLLLVGAIGLVIVLMIRASDPETWRWIAPEKDDAQANLDNVPVPPIDARVPRKAVTSDNGVEGAFRVAEDRKPATPYTMGQKTPSGKERAKLELWADKASLADVEDNSPFRAADFKAWSEVFDHLREATPQELSAARAPAVQFGQLFQQSDVYRGKLVTVSGTIRRCIKIPPSRLDERAGDMWQIWLFSGSDELPIVIYSLNIPEKFPVGNQVHQAASFQAVYFKKWVYAAKGGTMTAPLLIARNINWQAPAESQHVITATEVYIGVGCTLAAAVVMIAFLWRNNRKGDSEVEQLIRQRNRQEFEEHAQDVDVGMSVRDKLGALSAQMQKKPSPSNTDDQPAE